MKPCPFFGGHGFFDSPLGMADASLQHPPMKDLRMAHAKTTVVRLFCTAACFLPTLLMAHPGHFHPDETDEFDFLRATFFHTHGIMEYVVAALVIANITLSCLNPRPVIRLGAVALALGSLSALTLL